MTDNAPMTQFRDETIAAFEVQKSLLRMSVTTEHVRSGNTATFLVAGSGGASAVTRGLNGLIPARPDSNTQTSATLAEWHDLVRKSRFNIFESQGNQRQVMQRTTVGVINRKIDSDILTVLATGTQNTGAAQKASLDLVLKSKTILGNGAVPWDGRITAVVSPAFEAYLTQLTEYSSADYVNTKPYETADAAWSDTPKFKEWLGIKWIVYPLVSGVGTSAEFCFMYHMDSVGSAFDQDSLDTAIGYDDEHDYSYCRATAFLGSALLQNSGVVVMNHDGSEYVSA